MSTRGALLLLLACNAALAAGADTPPVINLFKMRGSGRTGVVKVDSGVVDSVAPGASGNVLTSNGATWVSQPSAGGGVTSVTASAPLTSSGGTTPNLSVPRANSSVDGFLSSLDWAVFSAKQSALSFLSPLSNVSGVVSMPVATQSSDGYLSANDWAVFNGKQPAGNYLTALTGDVAASGSGSVAAILAAAPHKVYVDFVLGNDTTGTGSIVRPWRSVQRACTALTGVATINEPATITLSGGNNDNLVDTSPITCPPNVNITSDYPIQVSPAFTIVGGSTNDGSTFNNVIFVGTFTWTRNDATGVGVTANNCEFFSGPVLRQTGSGVMGLTAFNTVFVNLDLAANGGQAFLYQPTLLGTTTFENASASSYYQLYGGYYSGNVSVSGGAQVYLSGVMPDVPLGAAFTAVTTAKGTPVVRTDSGSLPPTVTGTPTLSLVSYAAHTNTGALTGVLRSSGANGTIAGSATTSDLPEGSNLYYTQGRFDAALGGKSTTNLSEGANLYFTNARVDTEFDARLATKTTTNLAEGSNLYHTDARVQAAAKAGTPALELYVSEDAGNDANDGSILHRFKTIGAAVTAANALASYYKQVNVHVAPVNNGGSANGGYHENVSLTQQGVNILCDDLGAFSRACVVTGTLTVNLTGTAGGVNFIAASNEVKVKGMTFTSGASDTVTFAGSTFQRLIAEGCYFQAGAARAAVLTNTGTSSGTPSQLRSYDTTFENNSTTVETVRVTSGRFWLYGTTGTVQNNGTAGPSVVQDGPSSVIANLVQFVGEYELLDNTATAAFNLATIASGTNPCILTPSSPGTGYALLAYFGCNSSNANSVTGTGVVVNSPGNVRFGSSGDIASTVTQASLGPGLPQGELLLGPGATTGTNVMLSVKDGHVKVAQTTAPTTTLSGNAGTGGTPACTVSNASDGSGRVSLKTGTSAWAAGTQCTVNFNKAWGVAPVCVASPSNASAASKAVTQQINFTSSTSALTIVFGAADTVQTTYNWAYHCEETQ